MATTDELIQSLEQEKGFNTILAEAADHYGIPGELPILQKILKVESGGNPNAVSPKGATGLMQLMPKTARALGVKNLNDPRENIFGGVRYYKDMLDQFGGDRSLALAAYNAGPGRVKRAGGIPNIPETQKYVKGILNSIGNDIDPFSKTIQTCQGDNCGDFVAKVINTELGNPVLPTGGLDESSVREAANSLNRPLLERGDITPETLRSLGPGTVIRMTRQPGEPNYQYGDTHAEVTAVDPKTGQLAVASFTPGKGTRYKPIDDKYLSSLPQQVVATNLLGGDASMMVAGPGAPSPKKGEPSTEDLIKSLELDKLTGKSSEDLISELQQEKQSSAVPSDPRSRAREELLAAFGADPLGNAVRSIIDWPTKHITGPLAEKFVGQPLAEMGVPETTKIPIEALMGEAAGAQRFGSFPISGEEVEAPLRGLAIGAARTAGDIWLWSKGAKWLGQLLKPLIPEPFSPKLELTPTLEEMKASPMKQVVSLKEAENKFIQQAYDIQGGFINEKIPLGEGILEQQAANQKLIDGLTGSTPRTLKEFGEGLPSAKFPDPLAARRQALEINPMEQQYPITPASEKLTPARTESIIRGQSYEAQRAIDAAGIPESEFYTKLMERQQLREFYGGGTKKYYGGGPDTEDLVNFLGAQRNKGVPLATSLARASNKFNMTPEEVIQTVKSIGETPKGLTTAGEVPVVTKNIITNIDSTLGPAGTEVPTIPLTARDVAVRLGGSGDIKAPLLTRFNWDKDSAGKWQYTLKTNERLFSEMDDLYPGFRDQFYWPLKKAENTAHGATVGMYDTIDGISKGLPRGAGVNIGIDQISKRATGAERLAKMGVKVPPLSMEERNAADKLREIYESYLSRINEARALAGKQPIAKSDDYIPFMIHFTDQVKGGFNPVLSEARVFAAPTETPFRFKNPLTGRTDKVALNAFDIAKNYANIAERHIAISPQLEKLRKFQDGFTLPDGTQVSALMHTAPKMDAALNQMRTVISGIKEPMTLMEKMLTKLSDNLVISTLGAYPRSVINQTGSLAAGSAETGLSNMVKGMTTMLDPGKWAEAHKLSTVLSQRVMDISLESLHASQLSKISGKTKHAAMVPLEIADDFMASATWWGGMNKAKELGLKGEEAIKFADQIVIRTQASASPIDRAMIQSSAGGRLATAFQTFSIADANWIARNLFGLGNLNFSKLDAFKKLVTMTLTGMGLNYLQREVIGMPPGLPEPLTAFQRAKEKDAGPVETAWEVGKEFSPFIPVIGGSLAFGKVPFGAVGSTVGDVVTGYKSPLEAALMATGIPGMGLVQKLADTEKGRDQLNRFREGIGWPEKVYTTEPKTGLEALFGREPKSLTEQRTHWNIDKWLKKE